MYALYNTDGRYYCRHKLTERSKQPYANQVFVFILARPILVKKKDSKKMKTLIAYFSRADENYFAGQLRYIEVGNTERAAKMLSQITGADLFKIDPVKAYAKDYNTCIEEARADQQNQARPELKQYLDNIDQYDTIYLGYPNYWGTMPMAVFTFLERYDFSGKRIKPFCTHEGSGLGRSENDLKKVCPKAIVEQGLAIVGSRVDNSAKTLQLWAEA